MVVCFPFCLRFQTSSNILNAEFKMLAVDISCYDLNGSEHGFKVASKYFKIDICDKMFNGFGVESLL